MITVLRHQTVVDTKKKHGTSAIDGMGWPQGWYSVHPFALQNSVIQRRLLWILLKSLRHFLFPPPCSFTPALCPGCFQIWLNRLSGVSSFWFAYAIKEFAERDLIIIFPIKIFFDRYPAFSDTRIYNLLLYVFFLTQMLAQVLQLSKDRSPLPRCTSCYPLGVPISCVYYRCQYFRFNSVSPLQKVKDHRSRQINCSKSIPSCFFWLLVFAAGRKEEG